MVPGAGSLYGKQAGCIEAEEVNAGFAAFGDISADVNFGKQSGPWHSGKGAHAYAAHGEGDNADPGFPVEGVEGEARWQETL